LLYGTAWKEERTAQLTGLALRVGFRAIDTANQRKHYHEAGVGEALREAYAAGLVTRADLFLQTKFTSLDGQDHRLPYDREARPAVQVAQSMLSSLEHLGTDYVDSLVLHGPMTGSRWTDSDTEVWQAMVKERDAGRALALGVSNISAKQLREMAASHSEAPAYVQNRCYAKHGWDREVREICRERGIRYQGFSLLTANLAIVRHPKVAAVAARLGATAAQVIFRFALAIGMLPLTGTSNENHMRQDLSCRDLQLSEEEVRIIEGLTG
jgi:diketogulonate reductase-like aldo/keto reductase